MSAAKSKYRGTTSYFHVFTELVRAAQYRGLTTYQDIAVIMGLPIQGQYMGTETGHILGEISEDEVDAGRPMLSAVAVGVGGSPGPGFFKLARQLHRLASGQPEAAFWHAERAAVYEAWKRPHLRVSGAESRPIAASSSLKADDFRVALKQQFSRATRAGETACVVKSGELHRSVGGYPGPKHRMPVCCQVMKAAMAPGDRIVATPPQGKGANLAIEYRLPRANDGGLP